MDDIRPRCGWCNLSNPVYVAYHDAEWAVPSHDDHHLFEMLVLETFQAGLSWETILNKRERFRQAFDGFDIERIRRYDENKIAELMNDPGIIRNRRKIVFCQVGVGRFGVSFSPCERRVSGRFGVGRSCWLLVIALVIA